MSGRPNSALSAARVRTVKRVGRHADGNGLYLVVEPSGNKRWIQRLFIRGRRTDLGLGGWPLVSLAEARERAIENRKTARSGGDPLAEKRNASVPTFSEAADRVIALNAPTWRHPKTEVQWRSSLKTYAYPYLADVPVDQIDGADVLAALSPIWTTKPETARRVRRRVSAIIKWSVASGYRHDNPAGDALSQVLPKTPKVARHFRAIHYSAVPGTLKSIRSSRALAASKLCLEFQVLTATRPGEARQAQWSEVDVGAMTWTIPAERMKAYREHRVPLSERAMEILAEARTLDGGSGFVFPSRSGRPLSDMTHRKLLMTLGIDCVPHGFRSSFRDWAAEMTDAPHAVMEAALAHAVGNSTEAAYFRSDLFDRRRTLMTQWADYLR